MACLLIIHFQGVIKSCCLGLWSQFADLSSAAAGSRLVLAWAAGKSKNQFQWFFSDNRRRRSKERRSLKEKRSFFGVRKDRRWLGWSKAWPRWLDFLSSRISCCRRGSAEIWESRKTFKFESHRCIFVLTLCYTPWPTWEASFPREKRLFRGRSESTNRRSTQI